MRRSTIAIAVIAMLALTGCGPAGTGFPDNGSTPSDLDGDWKLVEGRDAQGAFDIKDADVTVTLTGRRTGGRTPCNLFGATVTIAGKKIDIEPSVVTEVACVDPVLAALEPRYLKALAAVTEQKLSGEALTLSGTGVILSFEKVPDVPISEFAGTVWRLEGLILGPGPEGAVQTPLGSGGIVFGKDGTVVGNGGCSDFTGSWEVSGGVVVITALEFADTDCPADLVAQEKHVATALGTGFTPLIEGDKLTIFPVTGTLGLVYRNSASSSA